MFLKPEDEEGDGGSGIPVEFLVSEKMRKIGTSINADTLSQNWEDVMYILSQDFLVLSYLNSFPQVLSMLVTIIDNFWLFVASYSFLGIVPPKIMEKGINTLVPDQRGNLTFQPTGDSLDTTFISERIASLKPEHFFFLRKTLLFMFGSLELFLGSLMIDYS